MQAGTFSDAMDESPEAEAAEPIEAVIVVESGTNGFPTILRAFDEPEYSVRFGSTNEPIFCAPCS
jgi:hypothetical protein